MRGERRTFAVMAIALGLAACADRTPTAPELRAADATALLKEGAASGLTLHPSGFGEDSYAAWRAKEGQPDTRGNGDHALYLQKMTTTATFAAGIAVIRGVEGASLGALTGLEWEHRADGWCGAGAPRWNVYLRDKDGNRAVIFLGCAAAVHTPGSAPGWIRDTYAGLGLNADQAFPFGEVFDRASARLDGLAIIFDEGTDVPLNPGYVYLDNIKVTFNGTVHTFTGPSDNGQ